jgi:hypothetical protein
LKTKNLKNNDVYKKNFSLLVIETLKINSFSIFSFWQNFASKEKNKRLEQKLAVF